MRAARAAFGLLTAVGGSAPPDHRAARWFAPVGAVLGLVVGAAWWGADRLWTPLLAAAVTVAVDAALTGMLHLDGVADSGDGLLAPMDRDRRLAVMRDPGIGAFGVAALTGVLLLRVGALADLRPDPLLLAGLWGASRGTMALALGILPYARPSGGLATEFGPVAAGRGVGLAAAGTVAALALAVAAGGLPAGPAAAAGLLAGSGAVLGLARRRLGGYSGDVLGAAGTVGETCGLMLAAAQW